MGMGSTSGGLLRSLCRWFPSPGSANSLGHVPYEDNILPQQSYSTSFSPGSALVSEREEQLLQPEPEHTRSSLSMHRDTILAPKSSFWMIRRHPMGQTPVENDHHTCFVNFSKSLYKSGVGTSCGISGMAFSKDTILKYENHFLFNKDNPNSQPCSENCSNNQSLEEKCDRAQLRFHFAILTPRNVVLIVD